MTQVYNQPVTRAWTNLGAIGVGYRKFFYEADTTTKKSIFADAELTTPLTNPIVSDSNGYFPQIFMEGTGDDYKTVFADDGADDPPTSPIWTADPVEVDANDINAFGTRPAQHWGTTTNVANIYQISPTTALADYSDDLLFTLEIHVVNTGASTLAVEDLNNLGSFLTALDIKKYDGAGGKIDIEAGDLQNQTYLFRIDSVNAVVLNPENITVPNQISSPSGMVSSFAMDIAPTGWLECDGTAVSRTTFVALFTAIGVRFGVGDGSTTFNVPDLRGEFIRGYDNGKGSDPDTGSRTDSGDGTTGDNVGTKQANEFGNHNHDSFVTANLFGIDDNAGGGGGQQNWGNGAGSTKTSSEGGNETRPRNVYMMYCIKT